MAVQKLETFAWGKLKIAAKVLPDGETVDLGTHSEMRVVDSDDVVIIDTDAAEWEGLEIKSEFNQTKINEAHIQAPSGVLDFFIGHQTLYKWVPTVSSAQ